MDYRSLNIRLIVFEGLILKDQMPVINIDDLLNVTHRHDNRYLLVILYILFKF